MDAYIVEYLLGCFFLGTGIDAKPNWFKVGVGVLFLVMAHFKWTFFY